MIYFSRILPMSALFSDYFIHSIWHLSDRSLWRFLFPLINHCCRSWLIDSRAIAKKVKNASCSSSIQITGCGAHRQCPNCHHRIDNSDVSPQWPGLPTGVKFDPSDAELLEHLAAKCGVGNSKAHLFIDEFIPTLEEDQGICYTHSENLPRAKTDGSSIHFLHRTINAYATGQRKHRKIKNQCSANEEHVRWHKTGKTKPVIESRVQKGWKKIMVLYKSSKRGCRAGKSNWVMHQYHLGTEEEEHDGEYVVSKISYQQQKQTDKNDDSLMIEEPDDLTICASPRTPKTNPLRPCKSIKYHDAVENMHQESEFAAEGSHLPQLAVHCEDDLDYPAWLAGESQAAVNSDLNCLGNSLLCSELMDSSSLLKNSVKNQVSFTGCAHGSVEMTGNTDPSCGISVLENLEFDTPPDLPLADLQFGSQESIRSWLDRL
ncbi:SUPPRESSOR OF GAMMA RESPONSE 1-like [Durio zibethinus]|uniref:SUPPRESSOR OF GAMMA RESPONSE 1-like n=1 Tax=Durio zibethinus TaxID=66656 RepID=A0A6P5ZG95_DURZI|nr:SUPPRESSOR OF GAMMA RESPONSE 1-like [Durio zibethinus]